MPKLRVHGFAISLDGYGAGPDQALDSPLGVGGTALHEWAFPTRTFRQLFGQDGGTTGIDDDFAARGFTNPPYHTPVFVLTNNPRASIAMDGGTTFHFVTDGIHAALKRATEAANGRDIRLGGGVATIRQYLRAGLIDEMHLAVAPVLLGSGEHLLAGIDTPKLGYRRTEHVATPNATHVVLTKRR